MISQNSIHTGASGSDNPYGGYNSDLTR
eukprot:COSAG02_NODE_1723_length_11188_cov_3.341510_1_plen_27_part_10